MEDYRTLARKAAEQEGVDPDLYERLVNQESRFNPSARSPKGALGLSQLLPATAKELGVNPNDPWENLVGGARYLARGLKASNGDVPTALAYYNAGPGNVQKYGGVPPFKETLDYIQKITGQGVEPSRGAVGTAGAGRGVAGTAAERVQPIVDRGEVYRADQIRPHGSFTQVMRDATWENQVRAETARPSLWETFGAGAAGSTSNRIIDAVRDNFFREPFKADPSFVPDLNIPAARASHEVKEDLAASRSKEEYDHILAKHETDTARAKALFSRGIVPGMALGMAAELGDLTNIIPGVAVHKLMAIPKLVQLANLSAKAAVGAEVAGNLISGTAIEGFVQTLEKKFNPVDLAVAAAFDVGLGVAGGVHSARAAAKLLQDHTNQVAELEREAARYVKARDNLGPDADEAALANEMSRLHAEELARPIVANTTPVPAKRQFMTSPEDEVSLPKGEAPTKAPESPLAVEDAAGYAGYLGADAMAVRKQRFAPGQAWEEAIGRLSDGKFTKLDELDALAPGVHTAGLAEGNPKKVVDLANHLAAKFLGDQFRLVVTIGDLDARGAVAQVSDSIALIKVRGDLRPEQLLRTMTHEIGHVIYQTNLSKLASKDLAKLDSAYQAFRKLVAEQQGDGNAARGARFSLLSPELQARSPASQELSSTRDYDISRHEFSAEQFVKYLEDDVAGAGKLGISPQVVKVLKNAIAVALEWLKLAKRENVGVTDEYRSFFDDILQGNLVPKDTALKGEAGSLTALDKPGDIVRDVLTDPYAQRIGAHLLPLGTDLERGVAQAAVRLHKMADEWAVQHPRDEAWLKRAQNLADNRVFNVASIGLIMLKSESNLVRMLASELLEDASGVKGAVNATAAIAKHIAERQIIGNSLVGFEQAHKAWASRQAGRKVYDEVWGGEYRDKFNRAVMAEREARSNGATLSDDPDVIRAADALDAAYSRSAALQRESKTLGWAALPTDSRGYTPHMMSAKAVYSLTPAQRGVLQEVLTDQYVTLSGWDFSFADKLAATVIHRMRARASGGYVHQVGGTGSGSVDIVRDALQAMGMTADEVRTHMERFTRGAMKHTKRRIQLDLNKVYDTPDGPFKLLDVFETDQVTLLRNQTQRVSGEVALARHGIFGKPHLELLRRVIDETGVDGKHATPEELKAFDQMCAEFLGTPFGKEMGKFLEGATQANTLIKLGGAVYNQIGEFINGVFHVGAARVLDSVLSIPRLHSEIKALVRGEAVDNPWIGSMEVYSGAEFGTDSYKVVLPYDNPNNLLPAYGADTPGVVNRLLRLGTHWQGVFSGWRFMNAVQQRGMAEQITRKAIKYIDEGKSDAALRGFGITEEVQAALKAELEAFATRDARGRIIGIDVTKIANADVREQFIQAVHRGTAQIIQGTFIGERGAWVHDGWMRALAQFRTFPIIAMEKQWGRSRNTHGTAAALGMMVGAMSMAVPLYAARVYAQSIGREDQEEYIERMLQPQLVARQTLNYIAQSGLSGDFVEVLTTVLPEQFDLKPTGGRGGKASDFVGSVVLPATGVVDDFYKAIQNPTDPDALRRVLPMGNVPYLLPLANMLRD